MLYKFLRILNLLFVLLTFAGAWYVFYTKGQASVGYAAVPLVFTLACLVATRQVGKKQQGTNQGTNREQPTKQ